MAHYYSTIGLSDVFSNYTINDAEPHHVEKLSQINVFIGANNSGKSRFMREISKLSATPFQLNGVDLFELKEEYDRFAEYISGELNNFINTHAESAQVEGFGRVDTQNLDLKAYIPDAYSIQYFDSNTKLEDLKKLLIAFRDNQITHHSYRGNPRQAVIELKTKLSSVEGGKFIDLLDRYIFDPINFKKYYIPTLRSLNDFDAHQNDPSEDIFALRIKQVYGYTDDDQVDVFTGQTLYGRVKSMLLGDLEDRHRMHEYENFLSSKLFDGQEVVIIPKEKDDVVNVRIGDTEYPIHQLGDGIQSLIILTFPLFECENGIFFIEEPELNMHPGMQRKFMDAIQSRPQHQYFITTHSNHLLDLTINYDNISVYTFRSKLGDPDSKEVYLVTYGDRNILELIGAQNTSIFLANKTIWVEGVTDRLYISKYLELFTAHNGLVPVREDIDYTFVEYGGNNITHWSFLDSTDSTINVERLCGTLMLVTDRDGNRKEARKAELASKLGDRYYLLPCNEIENSLSLGCLEKVIASYEGDSFVMPSGISNVTRRSKSIGLFIEEDIFQANEISMMRRGGYKDLSGTVKQKLAFCRKAIKGMTFEDMTTDAINLASAMYRFLSV